MIVVIPTITHSCTCECTSGVIEQCLALVVLYLFVLVFSASGVISGLKDCRCLAIVRRTMSMVCMRCTVADVEYRVARSASADVQRFLVCAGGAPARFASEMNLLSTSISAVRPIVK